MKTTNNENKITEFTDLTAWKEAHKLVLVIYKVTKNFPEDEKFGLTNQLRRAAVSITSCIAEGFSRNSSKEKCQFYKMSLGSLMEIQNQIIIARDIDYIAEPKFKAVYNQTIVVRRLLYGLIKSARSKA